MMQSGTSETAREIKLVGLQRAEFARASLLVTWSFRVQALIVILAAINAFVSEEHASNIVAVVLFFLAIVWAVLSLFARRSRSCAERARRYSLIVDGLGLRVSPSESLRRSMDFTVKPTNGQKFEDASYYASGLSSGPERLKEMLEESTFWSSQLAASSRNRLALFAGVVAVAAAIILICVVALGDAERFKVARAFGAALGAMVLTSLISDLFAFSAEHYELEVLNRRIESVPISQELPPDLVLLFADYNSIVETAPMFIPGIYERRKHEINRRWEGRTST